MAKRDSRLIIYEKIDELLFYSKNLLNKYPKSERFDLCTDIKKSCYEMLRLTMYAWKTKEKNKQLEYLEDCDIELAVLKNLVRVSYKLQYINDKNYMTWSEKLSEIGKMLGGWINFVKAIK